MDSTSRLLRDLEKGVHGDLCFAVLRTAKQAAERTPRSIFAYALLQVCLELCSYFEDEQGIPVELADEIDGMVRGPLKRLIESECFPLESPGTHAALGDLISSVRTLHGMPVARRH